MSNPVLCTTLCIKDPKVIRWYMNNGFDGDQFAFEHWLSSNICTDSNTNAPNASMVQLTPIKNSDNNKSSTLDLVMQEFCQVHFEETNSQRDVVDITTIKRMYEEYLAEKGYKSALKYQMFKDKLKDCIHGKYKRVDHRTYMTQKEWDHEVGPNYDMDKFPKNDQGETVIDINGHFTNLRCKSGPCVVPVIKDNDRRKRKFTSITNGDDQDDTVPSKSQAEKRPMSPVHEELEKIKEESPIKRRPMSLSATLDDHYDEQDDGSSSDEN